MRAPQHRRNSASRVPAPRRDWAYFFDLDGTLLEIAGVPTGVSVDAALRTTITTLIGEVEGALAIITGRPISDVDRLFPELRLPVAGQHGLERRSANGVCHRSSVPDASLALARINLRRLVARHPGLLLEDKGLSLALHYRRVPAMASYAHRIVHELQQSLGGGYSVQAGKRVVELKPVGRDKGAAIRDFMAESPFRGRRPVFIGDDTTDEFGFDVVNELGGISVKVGQGRTNAAWKLPNVRAVRRWLSLVSATPAAATLHGECAP